MGYDGVTMDHGGSFLVMGGKGCAARGRTGIDSTARALRCGGGHPAVLLGQGGDVALLRAANGNHG
jgi:hypothetical protein